MKKIIALISVMLVVIGSLVGCGNSNNMEQQSSIDMSDIDSSDMSYFTEVLGDRIRDQYSLSSSMYIDYDESTNFVQIHIPLDDEYLSDDDVYYTREAIITNKKSLSTRIVDIFNDTLLACNDSSIDCNVTLQVTDDGIDEHGVVFEVYCNHEIYVQDLQERKEDIYNTGSIMID